MLRQYVAAELRERRRDARWGWANASMQSRLPKWMISGHTRSGVLRVIDRMFQTLPAWARQHSNSVITSA